jgi:hypothetical protein
MLTLDRPKHITVAHTKRQGGGERERIGGKRGRKILLDIAQRKFEHTVAHIDTQ